MSVIKIGRVRIKKEIWKLFCVVLWVFFKSSIGFVVGFRKYVGVIGIGCRVFILNVWYYYRVFILWSERFFRYVECCNDVIFV